MMIVAYYAIYYLLSPADALMLRHLLKILLMMPFRHAAIRAADAPFFFDYFRIITPLPFRYLFR